MKRPISITIIAWLIIVKTALGGLPMLIAPMSPILWEAVIEYMKRSPIPVPIQLSFGYLGLLISVLCGVFILRGAHWARALYIAWCTVGLGLGMINLQSITMMIPGALIFGAIAFVLFRPESNAYFSGTGEVRPDDG